MPGFNTRWMPLITYAEMSGCRIEKGVTLRLHPSLRGCGELSDLSPKRRSSVLRGEAVSPSEPATKAGLYWGFQVRAASSLREVFRGHALGDRQKDKDKDKGKDKGKGKDKDKDREDASALYDCLIGTSERGVSLETVAHTLQHGTYKHMLVVFGGLNGLEAVLRDSHWGVSAAAARAAVQHSAAAASATAASPAAAAGSAAAAAAPADLRRALRALRRQGAPGGPLTSLVEGKSKEIPAACLFDYFINTCPLQASRTIRTEEAVWLSLAALRHTGIHSRGPPTAAAAAAPAPAAAAAAEAAAAADGGPLNDCQREDASEVQQKKRKPHLPPLLRVIEALERQSIE
ncbi:hypothetical protein, conserved [Eimeria acervulina]|uniref:Uncharacterized protein n=1 Tax=Eimeria acervulina TaxID=5801 RepID=U6GXH1_EIMAC|nr:hypothetical protein, conserved [Eimeria acervulina]CDI83948.1 hypothetical protein, conserved [Eimeria acervulina]